MRGALRANGSVGEIEVTANSTTTSTTPERGTGEPASSPATAWSAAASRKKVRHCGGKAAWKLQILTTTVPGKGASETGFPPAAAQEESEGPREPARKQRSRSLQRRRPEAERTGNQASVRDLAASKPATPAQG